MASVKVPQGDAVRGAKISADHFGVNYLSTKDEAAGGGALPAYANAVDDLAGSGRITVRFPGGGVAEGLGEPGAYTVLDDGAVTPGTKTYEFLRDAAAHGWAVQIVLPTWRFLDPDTLTVDTGTAAAEVDLYARTLFGAADELGVTIAGFEIGNEFDLLAEQTNGSAWLDGDATQAYSEAYAEIAAAMVAALDARIDASGFGGDEAPWIGVQALWSWVPENWRKSTEFRDAMEAAFDGAGVTAAVDAIIAHVYPWLELEANPLDWLTADTEIADNLAALDAVFGGGLDWVASEWQVSFGSGDAIELLKARYDGIKQLEPVVALFSQMVTAGFDTMNLWPVRNGAFTALETLEGDEKPMSYMFDMMSDQLVGTRVLDLNGRAAGTMWEVGDDIHVYGFGNSDRTVLYLGSRSDTGQVLDLDLSAYRGDGRAPTVAVTRIFVDDPDAKGYAQGSQVETAEYSYGWFQDHAAEVLEFSPYEMIALEVVHDAGAGERERGTAGRDFLYGSTGGDVLNGLAGDDRIHGRLGADRLIGGAGDDRISGGAQSDRIEAGDGDDTVVGGAGQDLVDLGAGADLFRDDGQGAYYGNDVIDGGAGDDRIEIGNGDDVVTGGTGADVFVFGRVSTQVGENRITDFTPGEDALEIADARFSTLEDLVARFAVYSDGTDTVVKLDNMGWVTLDGIDGRAIDGVQDAPDRIVVRGSKAADSLLGGTPFDARMKGRSGADDLYGRDGDDVLKGGAGADWLYGGAGDDRLVDGGGKDVLIGGDGADVFRLKADGKTDRIRDFEPGTDCIDLSRTGAAGMRDLDIVDRGAHRTEIWVDDERILVQVADGTDHAFGAGDFLF
ncbi:MAG: M10 family metallopeptidase C-terminal domain-containing protein [Maritimibacter sp.]|nr:M10 family metallopeptidase C-terminal domain-containing protein [Maritimibacter sp.]